MRKELEQIKIRALAEIESAQTPDELETARIEYVGRKGALAEVMKRLKDFGEEDRRVYGEAANRLKEEVEAAFGQKRAALEEKSRGSLAEKEWIDVTAPGMRPPEGRLHLVTRAIREISDIFVRLGFSRVRYPEVEWDWYAFTALNMPPDHPARDEWETFFIEESGPGKAGRIAAHPKYGKMILTPHTSSGQVREMERGELPIRMMNISKTYRRQADVSHVPMFHQFEGLLIDKDVAVTHLKGVLDFFVKEFFGPARSTRLRPFHFRFTEPSFEIDVSCGVCGGTGYIARRERCRLCKEGWLELGGAGMVHPNVLKAGRLDPREWSGFAFGWGVERTYMMKEGLQIDDVRLLYKNDLRFLKQF